MSHEKHLFTGLTSWIWLRLWVANNSDFSKHWNKTLAQNPVQFAPLAVCLLKLFEESRLGAMKTLQKLMCTPDVSQVIQQFSRISRWRTQPPCAEPVATVLKEGDSDANNLHTNLTGWNTKSSCSCTVTSWCCKYPTKLPVFKQFQMVIPVRFYTPTVSFKFKFLDFVHLKGRTSLQNTLRLKKKRPSLREEDEWTKCIDVVQDQQHGVILWSVWDSNCPLEIRRHQTLVHHWKIGFSLKRVYIFIHIFLAFSMFFQILITF